MTVFRKSWADFLCLCLLLCTTGVSGQFELQPENVTSLLGSEAQFNASVQGPWTYMTWNVGEFLVLTISTVVNTSSSSPRFSARFCSSDKSCVTFTVHNVSRQDSGPVVCSVQGDYGARRSTLYVQESGRVSVSGGDRTVQQDEQVTFHCEAAGWFPAATVSWSLNGLSVNSSLFNTTSSSSGDTYTSSSVYTFTAVHNSTVTCQASVSSLTNPISSSVQLVVVPKPTDWTVLIAVVLSFSLFALVILLIIGVIFCYQRRKEKQPNYQAEMMRQRTQSQSQSPGQGQVNPVFTVDGQTSLPQSDRDSGFSHTNGAFYERPVSDHSDQSGLGYSPAFTSLELGFTKHRHVTIV